VLYADLLSKTLSYVAVIPNKTLFFSVDTFIFEGLVKKKINFVLQSSLSN